MILRSVTRLFLLAILALSIWDHWVLAWAKAPENKESKSTQCQVLDPALQRFYQGGCRQGKAHGQGVAYGADGALYQGQFKDGLASGYGVKLYANGDAYAGEWRQGYRHGYGVYEYGEQSPWRGDKYVGDWQWDQRHGQGTYYFYPTGEPFVAQWKQGKADTTATPLLIRRQRMAEVLGSIIGKKGTQVCSTLTDGASPDRVAQGQVIDWVEDRILVRVDSPEVLQYSALTHNPRWDIITQWRLC